MAANYALRLKSRPDLIAGTVKNARIERGRFGKISLPRWRRFFEKKETRKLNKIF